MYLSKNSRCVLQKSPWFSPNLFGRSFKITFMKSLTRWPEDDPSKPPLRLNIPKDHNLVSAYQCNSNTTLTTSSGMDNTKLSSKWFGLRQCQYSGDNRSGNGSGAEDKTTLDGGKNSQLSDSQNYPVRNKSSESLGKSRDDRIKRDKGLRLKKVRSYEGIKFGELSGERKDIEAEENGILTIQVVLDERTGGDSEVVDRLSVGKVSDAEIKALAEAVVKELKNKECFDSGYGMPSEKAEEEAYLVIINVTDKDPSEGALAAKDKTFDHTEKFISDQLQVRDLDLTDILDRLILKEKISRYSGAKKWKKRLEVSDSWDLDGLDALRSHPADGKSYRSLISDKKIEKGRRQFERNLLKPKISSNFKANNKKKKVSDIWRPKMSYTQQIANPGFIRPVEYAQERETRTKIVPENYFEKKTQLEGLFEPAVHAFELKPLAKQIRLVDEVPESLNYPYSRKAGCELSDGRDISRINSSKIRSYHNSCGKYSDVSDKKPFSIPKFDQTSNGDVPNIVKSEKCNKLNNASRSNCELSQNDIYLQEGIGNKLATEDSKNISKEVEEKERYEPDISEISLSKGKIDPGHVVPKTEDISYRIRGFGQSGTENFEMNKECLGGSVSDSGDNRKSMPSGKESIANIGKKEGPIPKIGDNIANLANEGLSDDKGASDVDSLSMMKKVREIVDFDLKNAEKIFVPESPGKIDEAAFKSVILHDETKNEFKVDSEGLEAVAKKNERDVEDRISKNLARDFVVYVKVPSTDGKKYSPKKGESILVYDEKTRVSNVDFGLLNEFGRPEEWGEKRGEREAAQKVEDETKIPEMTRSKVGDPQEVRRKNSDFFDDVFERTIEKKPAQENPLPEHYVSENILKMSKNSSAVKVRSSKVETVKLNVTTNKRPPSKVTEINLNQKSEDGKGTPKNNKTIQEKPEEEKSMFKDIEKYGTTFGDPEYEEKNMKINTDLESNPNLKRLDSCYKTLVLQEVNKGSDNNVESWIKDETDKMATLLLKVLQDAADGKNKRRVPGKTSVKGNPYEAIRKKQESGLVKSKRRDMTQNKALTAVARPGSRSLNEQKQNKNPGGFPMLEVEGLDRIPAEFFLPKSSKKANEVVAAGESSDEIPGPDFLRKLSSLWKFMPDIGCQATIFLMLRMFSVAKFFTSFLSLESENMRNDPFRGLFKKYGPIVKLRGPLTGDVVLLNRPEDMSKVFYQTQVTPARSVFDSLEHCRNRIRRMNFVSSGIAESCNGIDWDILRKSAVDVSHKGCLHYFDMLKSTNAMLLNKIDTIRNKQKQVPDDFIHELKKWSMEGLCGLLLDKSLGFLEKKTSQMRWICESERLLKHLQEATDSLCQCESKFQLWRFVNTPAMSSLNQSYQSLDLILSKYVYQAEISLRRKKKAINNNKPGPSGCLNFLESALLYDQMTSDEITSNLIDILLIGVNTSSAGLGFLLYNLALNSRVQHHLFKEVKDVLPNKDSDISYHQLHSLKYLQACLKESMRVNVPIPFLLKVLPNEMELAQYHVPSGTHVIVDYQMACMKEQNFDEPDRFKPERWLDQDNIHPFSSVPFCNGPRSSFVKCLADIQLWACIAKIVRNYHIKYHFGDIKSSGRIISQPHKPLKLTFVERSE